MVKKKTGEKKLSTLSGSYKKKKSKIGYRIFCFSDKLQLVSPKIIDFILFFLSSQIAASTITKLFQCTISSINQDKLLTTAIILTTYQNKLQQVPHCCNKLENASISTDASAKKGSPCNYYKVINQFLQKSLKHPLKTKCQRQLFRSGIKLSWDPNPPTHPFSLVKILITLPDCSL